jgi:hypothetical protein
MVFAGPFESTGLWKIQEQMKNHTIDINMRYGSLTEYESKYAEA